MTPNDNHIITLPVAYHNVCDTSDIPIYIRAGEQIIHTVGYTVARECADCIGGQLLSCRESASVLPNGNESSLACSISRTNHSADEPAWATHLKLD
jgi:hypothetical protein